jgi:hypothetical protein
MVTAVPVFIQHAINPLSAELNSICHLLALLGAHHILHVGRIRVKHCVRGAKSQECLTLALHWSKPSAAQISHVICGERTVGIHCTGDVEYPGFIWPWTKLLTVPKSELRYDIIPCGLVKASAPVSQTSKAEVCTVTLYRNIYQILRCPVIGYSPQIRRHICNRMYDVTYQNTFIFIFRAMRTWDLSGNVGHSAINHQHYWLCYPCLLHESRAEASLTVQWLSVGV